MTSDNETCQYHFDRQAKYYILYLLYLCVYICIYRQVFIMFSCNDFLKIILDETQMKENKGNTGLFPILIQIKESQRVGHTEMIIG